MIGSGTAGFATHQSAVVGATRCGGGGTVGAGYTIGGRNCAGGLGGTLYPQGLGTFVPGGLGTMTIPGAVGVV